MQMILTVTEALEITEALKQGLRLAKEFGTDEQINKLQAAYDFLNNKDFTEVRTQEEINTSFINSFADDCRTYGSN